MFITLPRRVTIPAWENEQERAGHSPIFGVALLVHGVRAGVPGRRHLSRLAGRITCYPEGIFCPTCERVTKHHRVKSRPAYSCQFCGHHVYPMVGTIFEGSSTSLRLWFYAMYLMASTRCGISAKQLERELGVSYPTALAHVQADPFDAGTRRRAVQRRSSRWTRPTSVDVASGGTGSSARRAPALGRPPQDARIRDGAACPRRPARSSLREDRAVAREERFGRTCTVRSMPGSERLHRRVAGLSTNSNDLGTHTVRVDHSKKVYVSGDVHTQDH